MDIVKKQIKQNWLIIFVLSFANLVSFWPLYFKGLLPFPGDLLVSFFFPWNSGGFPGYNSWTTHKEYIASDAIRALFPWKVEAIRQFLSGQVPLWNPYNFSGTPLLANFQSGVFFPTNIFYLFLPPILVWIAEVTLLLTIFGFFAYLFLRRLKLSPLASTFGAIVISNLPYLVNWHELLVVTRTALFLPLDLYLIEKYLQTKKSVHLFFLSITLVLAIFAGHPQTAVMVFIFVAAYALYRRLSLKKIIFTFVVGVLLGGIQLMPSWEFYQLSAREAGDTTKLFLEHLFPWRNMATSLAPDFFGNPVTGNFWGWDYHNSLAYVGIGTLTLSLFSLFLFFKNNVVRFFTIAAISGLLFATFPLAIIFLNFKIPILSTGVPARNIFFWQFSFGILTAYGIEFLLEKDSFKKFGKLFLLPLATLFGTYLLLWILVSIRPSPELLISRNNLIFPSVIFVVSSALIMMTFLLPKIKHVFLFALLILTILEFGRYFNKIQPFASPAFIFPSHPVITYLQNNASYDRFIGAGTAKIDTNFATYYQIFDPQGYDPLYPLRYGQLIAAGAAGGRKAPLLSRADATITNLDKDDPVKDRLLDLLGVKYVLDNENQTVSRDWEPGKLETLNNRHRLVWLKDNKWRIYERQTALPRVFLAGGYEVSNSPSSILTRLFEPSFNIHEKVILEKSPGTEISNLGSAEATVAKYSPNLVKITTMADSPRLLFLSDNYYPGWQATIDGLPVEILRANYTFRALPVPRGSHTVEFRYNPDSFRAGLITSLIGVILLTSPFLWPKFLKTKP